MRQGDEATADKPPGETAKAAKADTLKMQDTAMQVFFERGQGERGGGSLRVDGWTKQDPTDHDNDGGRSGSLLGCAAGETGGIASDAGEGGDSPRRKVSRVLLSADEGPHVVPAAPTPKPANGGCVHGSTPESGLGSGLGQSAVGTCPSTRVERLMSRCTIACTSAVLPASNATDVMLLLAQRTTRPLCHSCVVCPGWRRCASTRVAHATKPSAVPSATAVLRCVCSTFDACNWMPE